MNSKPTRRLYESHELPELLRLPEDKVDWLVATGQLCPIRICGELRFDIKDIDRLIQSYKTIANRRNHHAETRS